MGDLNAGKQTKPSAIGWASGLFSKRSNENLRNQRLMSLQYKYLYMFYIQLSLSHVTVVLLMKCRHLRYRNYYICL